VLKYGLEDIRDVLERASARETAARVAVGSLARQLLGRFGVEVLSHVTMIGGVGVDESLAITAAHIRAIPDDSPLHCADPAVEQRMIAAIDRAKEAGDTLGGAFEVVVTGLPLGLGSYVQWDRKLDGRLAQALMSIHAIKAVGVGKGPDVATLPGSRIHDEIVPAAGAPSGDPSVALSRLTNNAGGLEGGVTNGEELRITAYMKPIATLMQPLRSVDLVTLKESPAAIERSDVCAVTAAAVVGEAMVSLVLADAFLEKFGADNIPDIAHAVDASAAAIRARFVRAETSDPEPAQP
jgi:chorismate synthase